MPGFLVARSDHGCRLGDPIPVPPGATVLDGKTLVDLGGGRAVFAQFVTLETMSSFTDSAVADEARVLPIRRSPFGERSRTWQSVADESSPALAARIGVLVF